MCTDMQHAYTYIVLLFLTDELCEILTNPMNGEVVFMERFVSSVANYSCNIGFELVGSESRTCQSGSGWSGVEPSCERKHYPLLTLYIIWLTNIARSSIETLRIASHIV